MNTIYLLRHSLTEANERHLYGGSTDSPLTEKGRAIAESRRGTVPDCDIAITSGMRRADETLMLMTGRTPDLRLRQLREMDFGAFEMRSYDELKHVPEYTAWIGDGTGRVRCPGGECTSEFRARALEGAAYIAGLAQDTACVVCHGGVIVNIMEAWFPEVRRNFYQWQPAACRGYRIALKDGRPAGFEEV